MIGRPATPERYTLRIHDIDPTDIEPNGDRYVVEVIDIDETALAFGRLLVMTQQVNQQGPQADPTIENRGVLAAVIVTAGNGHLLGLPDAAVALSPGTSASGRQHEDSIGRAPADVPMFYAPGDVVMVDHNAKGRALKILGREARIVGQIDILARIKGLRLRRSEDGSWEREE